MSKIKGCKRNKRNTHAANQDAQAAIIPYKGRIQATANVPARCLSEYTLPNFLPKTKGDTAHGINLIYKINSIKGCVVFIYTYVYHTYSRSLPITQILFEYYYFYIIFYNFIYKYKIIF